MYELIKARRSIRKFQKREVEKEKIDIITKSALLSPSSRSIRPWEFIVVDDKNSLQQLSQCKAHSATFLAEAPLGIVVIADPETGDTWIEDTSIASIIIQLVAESLGLGSCWIQVRGRFDSQGRKAGDIVREVLNIPPNYEVESIIAIGYPDEKKRAYREDELLYDKIHYNQYKG
ncbi:MAG: NAD(P)H nitroreductase [Clostridiaceae bacterium]|nr:NAD(P)H nitroreductase [Clostridiaceae bacterium]